MHISKQQETEDVRMLAESIVETIRVPLLILDDDQAVVSANSAFYQKFRADRREAEGTSLYDLGDKQWDIPELRVLLEKIIPEKEMFENFELTHVSPNIGQRIMVLNARKIHQKGGKRNLILLSIEDLTDQVRSSHALERSEAENRRLRNDATRMKQVEDELSKLTTKLDNRISERTASAEAKTRQLQALAVELVEAEEKERRRFAQLLHDDLQQVLAASKLQLEGIIEQLPHEQKLGYIRDLLAESIKKTRHLSHELSPTVLDQPDFTTALVWLTEQMKDRFGLQVRFQKTDAQMIESAPLRRFLFRAVQEMLFNVVKHAGVKHVRIGFFNTEDWITVSVADKGSGFDPDYLDSMLRTDGLGLKSISERAKFFGGNLEIDSAPGKGSKITLKIPLEPAESGDTWILPDEKGAASGASVRILLADDHKVMRQGLSQLLSRQPEFQVVGEASNGREALEMARRLKPDLVVLDISMPEMDGIKVTRQVKQEMPDMHVIGLTMFDENYLRHAMLMAGAEIVVSKGESSEKLLEAVYTTVSCVR